MKKNIDLVNIISKKYIKIEKVFKIVVIKQETKRIE